MAASKDEDIQVTSRQWGVYTQLEYEAPGCKHSIGSIKCTMQKLTLLSELGPRKYSTFSKQQGVFFVQTHDFAIFTAKFMRLYFGKHCSSTSFPQTISPWFLKPLMKLRNLLLNSLHPVLQNCLVMVL